MPLPPEGFAAWDDFERAERLAVLEAECARLVALGSGRERGTFAVD